MKRSPGSVRQARTRCGRHAEHAEHAEQAVQYVPSVQPVQAQRGAPRRRLGGARQRGQALTEFLAVALALLPLFLLLAMIAKYQDIAHATQLASRYAAFDAMARNDHAAGWKPEAELADEVRRRFFGRAGVAIKTGDVAGNFNADRNLFWRDPSGRPLIADFADVAVGFGAASDPVHAAGFTAASDAVPFVLHDDFDLQARGVYTATVAVRLANLPAGRRFLEPLDRLDLTVARGTGLVLDGWAARTPQQVEARIGHSATLYPAAALSALSPVVDAWVGLIDASVGLAGPRLGRLDFWRDVVPHDRLRRRPGGP